MLQKHLHHLHILILVGFLILSAVLLLANIYIEKINLLQPLRFGVSFSPRYAKELGLDPKKTFSHILKDLRVRNLRLTAYWDEIEKEKDRFDFAELDYYIDQASKNQAKVILAIGYKLPRWPECRAPLWLDQKDIIRRQKLQLRMIEATIRHFDKNSKVSAFQIENEPLLEFGLCPPPDRKFFQKEIEFVRSLTKKSIIVTDSGELRTWVTPMRQSDIFGTTLYRKVYDSFFGDLYYPIPPWYYRVKSDLVRKIFAQGNQKTIVSELQAEVWAAAPLTSIPVEEQVKSLPLKQLEKTIHFAKRTGLNEFYIWGVEWWYYLKNNGQPQYLEYAKTIF